MIENDEIKTWLLIKYPVIRFFANIRNWYYGRKFKKQHGLAKLIAVTKFFIQRSQIPSTLPTKEYYNNKESLYEMAGQAYDLKKRSKSPYLIESFEWNKIKTITFGDSLIAFCKGKLDSVPSDCNFARPGDTGRGFADVINAVGTVLHDVKVENVIIGCFGNNARQFQSPQMIIHEMKAAYDQAHIFFPDARIIFYAFPPVYDLYANLIYPEITTEMHKIAGIENVIRFDDMRMKYGILPGLDWSADGTHLGPEGIVKFDRKIMEKIGHGWK